jgi:hypothetical protein
MGALGLLSGGSGDKVLKNKLIVGTRHSVAE